MIRWINKVKDTVHSRKLKLFNLKECFSTRFQWLGQVPTLLVSPLTLLLSRLHDDDADGDDDDDDVDDGASSTGNWDRVRVLVICSLKTRCKLSDKAYFINLSHKRWPLLLAARLQLLFSFAYPTGLSDLFGPPSPPPIYCHRKKPFCVLISHVRFFRFGC